MKVNKTASQLGYKLGNNFYAKPVEGNGAVQTFPVGNIIVLVGDEDTITPRFYDTETGKIGWEFMHNVSTEPQSVKSPEGDKAEWSNNMGPVTCTKVVRHGTDPKWMPRPTVTKGL